MGRAIVSQASVLPVSTTARQLQTAASSLRFPAIVASRKLANDCDHGSLPSPRIGASTVPLPSTKKSFYRRDLPSQAITLDSSEGQELLHEAKQGRTAANFLKLITCYQTQSELEYCGLASLSMVLNALEIDPGRVWKGNWRWIDESMLVSPTELAKIRREGITLGKAAHAADSNGAEVLCYRSSQINIDSFREYVSLCTSNHNYHMILSYDRKGLEQTGAGHFSPIGAYHSGRDMVLILDVARYKYKPHWVALKDLWGAMNTIDESTQKHRGLMIVSRGFSHKEPSMLYSKIYEHEGWNSFLKYMVKDFPLRLGAEHVTDVEKVLSLVFDAPPIGLKVLVPWVAEVESREDGHVLKADLLMQVQDTELFSYVSTQLESSAGNDYPSTNLKPVQNGCIGMHRSTGEVLTLLLFGMPYRIWSSIQEENLRQEITSLLPVYKFPLLQEEVLNLRRELEFLMIDFSPF